MICVQKSFKKILASGISSNHAGQAGIFQFALLDLKSLTVFGFTSLISSHDITYLTTRLEKICK